jgi:hypothetical protein
VDGITLSAAAKKVEKELSQSWGSEKSRVEKTFKSATTEAAKTYVTYPASDILRAQKNLRESPAAVEYLKSRGIDLETALRCRVGFRQDVGKLAGRGNEDIAGKGWLVFASFDNDRIVTIEYRSIERKAFCRQPGMKTSLWNADRIDLFEPLAVVEGKLDALTLEQAGIRTVSIPSASAVLSSDDIDKIASASQVYLAGDCGDVVGKQAMDRLKIAIKSAKRIDWCGFKDANDLLMKRCGGNAEAFRRLFDELRTQSLISPMEGVVDAVEGIKYVTTRKMEDEPLRLRFPWKAVDSMAVLLPGSVTTIYATQTGCGKTQFVNQVALYNARKNGDVILNYQAELSHTEIFNIIISHVLGKDRNTLESGDGPKAAELLEGVKYYIGRDTSITSIEGALDLIVSAARHLGVTIAILDHFHHFSCGGSGSKETDSQAEAMRRIKRISQELGIKFIVVSQPRKSDQQHEKTKSPNISAIKGSESLTSGADLVLGMHRDMLEFDPANPPRDLKDPITEIHNLKARAQGDNSVAFTRLMFNGNTCSFHEIEDRNDAPPPATMFE